MFYFVMWPFLGFSDVVAWAVFTMLGKRTIHLFQVFLKRHAELLPFAMLIEEYHPETLHWESPYGDRARSHTWSGSAAGKHLLRGHILGQIAVRKRLPCSYVAVTHFTSTWGRERGH